MKKIELTKKQKDVLLPIAKRDLERAYKTIDDRILNELDKILNNDNNSKTIRP